MRDVKSLRVTAISGVVGLLLVLGGTLHAQAILGTWQGTLPNSSENQRIVLKIEKADNSPCAEFCTGSTKAPKG